MSMPLPGRRPRRRRYLPAAALGVLAAAAAAVTAASLATQPGPTPGSASGPSPSRRPPTNSDGRMPSRAAGPAAVSTAGWQGYTIDGAVVPMSPSGGPSRRSGGLASGFADTPAGAVLAAANIAVRVSGQLGPGVFAPTIGAQVTGAAARALLDAAWEEYGQAGGQAAGGPAGPATATVTSFALDAWLPSQATVTLVAAAGGGSRAQVAVAVQVQWLGGDWRMTAPAGGTFTGAPVASPAPPGFTPLPGA